MKYRTLTCYTYMARDGNHGVYDLNTVANYDRHPLPSGRAGQPL